MLAEALEVATAPHLLLALAAVALGALPQQRVQRVRQTLAAAVVVVVLLAATEAAAAPAS